MRPVSDRTHPRQFASDNYSGICPEVFEAFSEANHHHAPSYGSDAWTHEARRLFQELFETDCEVYFVFNGTAANSIAIASFNDTFHSILCHEHAHILSDECGAPGFFAHGCTLAPVPGKNGKLLPATIDRIATRREDIHHPKPGVLSLTQSTELGTVYTPRELHAIARIAKMRDLDLHMDGARFANAVASLQIAPKDITWKVGVDVLCFGGTKNGMAFGEAIVFFNKEHARLFGFRQKQGGQLSSKMRFLASQWIGALQNDTWLKHAAHANLMANLLSRGIRKISGLRVMYPVQANAVFVQMPTRVVQRLHQAGWLFYNDVGPGGYARLMCSWDTRASDVDQLLEDLLRYTRS